MLPSQKEQKRTTTKKVSLFYQQTCLAGAKEAFLPGFAIDVSRPPAALPLNNC